MAAISLKKVSSLQEICLESLFRNDLDKSFNLLLEPAIPEVIKQKIFSRFLQERVIPRFHQKLYEATKKGEFEKVEHLIKTQLGKKIPLQDLKRLRDLAVVNSSYLAKEDPDCEWEECIDHNHRKLQALYD